MIRARSMRYAVGEFALEVSLEVADGEYLVLLGSTGSGKTVLLECLCGLRELASGSVEVDGRDVTDAEPRARRIGYVPQDGALFDHLDVSGNIGFGLRVRGLSAGRRSEKVGQFARMLGIEHLLGRRIRGLSGGERQRVALARALACEPSLLLLDEPVSALDEFTRDAVCRELVKLHRASTVSIIHVCHSFDEAGMVADRIGVVESGRIVQTGTADELMSRPASRYVANILRLENVFSGTATRTAAGSRIEVDGFSFDGPAAEGEVELLVRPWDIRIADGSAPAGPNIAEGKIVHFSLAGPLARMRIDGPLPLAVQVPRESAKAGGLAEGKPVRLAFGREAVYVFDRR